MARKVRDMVKVRAESDRVSKELQDEERAQRAAKTARLKAQREAQQTNKKEQKNSSSS
ncbi:hypothetical protein O7A70_00355 [Mesorhizobium sp. Cs1299R1N1]|uniref:hypothetical protein n=1 Tax=unclassified Mesorhizobium TaxID=325217 RepID=UPI00301E3B7B